MGHEYETTTRLYLTSDKRALVPEGDKRARFLLAIHGPVDAAKVKEIRRYRGGDNYLHKIGSGAKAEKPGEDKGEQPGADKAEKPGKNKTGPANLGPEDLVDFGKFNGTLVKDLSDKYLANLARVSDTHRTWAQAELDRRAKGAD